MLLHLEPDRHASAFDGRLEINPHQEAYLTHHFKLAIPRVQLLHGSPHANWLC